MSFLLSDAIASLCPGAEWHMDGDNYNQLVWLDKITPKPSLQQIQDELNRINQAWIDSEYQRKRAAEYPPATDYLDAVVKNDTEQMQAYIDACLAVKAKYPKPE